MTRRVPRRRAAFSAADDRRIINDARDRVPTCVTATALDRTEASVSSRRWLLRKFGNEIPRVAYPKRAKPAAVVVEQPLYPPRRTRNDYEAKPSARRRSSERSCLCCGNAFNSSGPGNRLCPRCRSQSTSPYAP